SWNARPSRTYCWVSTMMRPSGVSIAPALESPCAPIHAWTPSAMVTRWASPGCWVMCGDCYVQFVKDAWSVVPVEGIEPPLLAEHDFEPGASPSPATRARAHL